MWSSRTKPLLGALAATVLVAAALAGCDVPAEPDSQPEGTTLQTQQGALTVANVANLQAVKLCGGLLGMSCPEGTVCVHRKGECGKPFGLGLCIPVPGVCPDVLDPVCGCDGVTYPNECAMVAAGVSMAHEGPCQTKCMSDDDCPAGTICDPLGCNTTEGACTEVVPVKACPRKWDPVCGCNGKTYPNDCVRRALGVALDHTGPCKPVCKLIKCPDPLIPVDTNADGCPDKCKLPCTSDKDCPMGQACTAHEYCPPCVYADPPCKVPCKMVQWCEDQGCCETDADCTSSEGPGVCVSGVCKQVPPPGACWSDADCGPGQECVGASVCPCGALCILPDHPGKCTPACQPDEVCWDGIDNDCDGQVDEDCTCKVDADCPDGLVCELKEICPPCTYSPPFCDVPCLLVGKCVPPPPPGCCETDADCVDSVRRPG
jgi:Kazal-type serine protease inhibitor domain./Protein metal binding site.